jgi:flagellin
MSLSVRSNPVASYARNTLIRHQRELDAVMTSLSTGKRVNVSSDDPTTMATSVAMEHRMHSQEVAYRNAQSGVALLQTAEGGLQSIVGMLDRMRVLAVRAATEPPTGADRIAADIEFQALKAEIDRVAQSTDYNGKPVLGASLVITFQIGVERNSLHRIELTVDHSAQASSMALGGAQVNDRLVALSAIDSVEAALSIVLAHRSQIGSAQSRLEMAVTNLENAQEHTAVGLSRLRDADFAFQTSELARLQILTRTGTSILAQANQQPSLVMTLVQSTA